MWQVFWSETDSVQIEGPNWMEALSKALTSRGQTADFSFGTQFNIDQDGSVTVMDPHTQQNLRIVPLKKMTTSGPQSDSSSAAQLNSQPPASQAASETQDTRRATPSQSARAAETTVQPSESEPGSPELESREKPTSDILYAKDLDLSTGIPLTYRERAIYIGDKATEEAEHLTRHEIDHLKQELASYPAGQLVRVAAFDHRWSGQPKRPPLVALEWRDWNPAVRRTSIPPKPTGGRRSTMPPAARLESQERLGIAFDALDDMLTIGDPGLALGMAINALKKTIPSECIYAFVYDINAHALKCVQANESTPTGRLHKVNSVEQGVLGLAVQTMAANPVMIVNQLGSDPRFVQEFDAPGLSGVRDTMVITIGRESFVFGAVQLINRVDQDGYSETDRSVAQYIRTQLSEFMVQHRYSMPPV